MKKGQIVFFVQSGNIIRQAKVLNNVNGICTIKFLETGGGIRVRKEKLFVDEKQAKEVMNRFSKSYHRGASYKEYW